MNEQDLIYELLEKGSLSEDETLRMNGILDKNKDMKSFVEFYNKAKTVVENNSHIELDILAEYVLFKSKMEGILIKLNLAEKIENHLRACEKCMDDFKILNEEYSSVDEFVSETILPGQTKEKEIYASKFQNAINSRTVYKFLYAFAVIVIIYAGSVFITNYSVPEYNREIAELSGEMNFNSRGRASEEFLIGVAELEKGNFEDAINSLKNDLVKNRDSKTIFYTHFILGQAYLRNTQRDLLGINLGVDETSLQKSIEEFKNCIAANINEQFASINYDSHYFLGRAYLLNGNVEKAIDEFNTVIKSRGKYINEAKELISAIESE
jgi:tetratricopeptide (TPR) repeat protein